MIDFLFEKMPYEDTIKLKARLKSLSRRAPMFRSDDEEIDISEIFGIQEHKHKIVDFWQID